MDFIAGSPLSARQQGFVYIFIIIALIIIVLLVIISLLLSRYRSHKMLKRWIEANKNKETKYKNVKAISHIANLTKAETKLLWSICHKNHLKNIEFTYKDKNLIDSHFKLEYEKMNDFYDAEQRKKVLFSLRFKLENAHDKRLSITSTKRLKDGQQITYYDSNKMPWTLTVFASTKDLLYLKLPQNLFESNSRPQTLSKINCSFILYDDFNYLCQLRVVRYEEKNDEHYMIVSHTNNLHLSQRRMSKRLVLETLCTFNPIKFVNDGQEDEMEIIDKDYKGIIKDISCSGCKILCPYPIKKDQFIHIKFELEELGKNEISGLIVDTKKTQDLKTFTLHIKFINISLKLSNLINAFIYRYL